MCDISQIAIPLEMLYSSEDDYQSPAVIRRFGAAPKGKKHPAPAAVALPLEPEAPPKRRRITYSIANIEKGTVAKPLGSLTEFGYMPLLDTLKLIAERDGFVKVKTHTTPRSGKGEVSHSTRIRWTRESIVAIASMLEMKVRRLLEVAVDTLSEGTVTLGDKAIAKAMKILGESQALRGMSGYDAEITKLKLRDAAKESGDKALTKDQKAAVLEKIKAAKESDWTNATKSEKSPLGRAYDLFPPRVLDYFFGETGAQRVSRSDVRRILSHFAVNILSNMVARIHPILTNAKRCTVTVKDVDNAKDDTDRTTMLGFGSIARKRVNPIRSRDAREAAARRKQTVVPLDMSAAPGTQAAIQAAGDSAIAQQAQGAKLS